MAFFRLCCWYYANNKALVKPIWEETLREFSFVGVEQIIASMK
jgi:hypothetical protein